jgi:hypothetical protein
MVKRPNLTLLASVILDILSRLFDWNIASYPPGTTWYFNPFCWQLMFVFAAWCGSGNFAKISKFVFSRTAMVVAVLWLLFAFVIVMSWHVAFLEAMIPKWMIKVIYPIDKTDLDMLRFTHFLALATLVSRFIPARWAELKAKWAQPMILCGQHSLPIFCLGVFLSFSAHWILMQYTRGVWEQLVVSLAGILIMVGAAWVLDRANRVPDLFVDVVNTDEPEAAIEGSKALSPAE